MAIAAAPRSRPSRFYSIRPPEGVADQDRLGRQAIDNLRIVVGDVVDSVVGGAVRVGVVASTVSASPGKG
jgi:hypothetical protein